MHVNKVRTHRCAVCKKGIITESVVEKTEDGKIQVHSERDSHAHSDYRVSGGRLLNDRPKIYWSQRKTEEPTSLGGICNTCIASPVMQRLMRNINLAPMK